MRYLAPLLTMTVVVMMMPDATAATAALAIAALALAVHVSAGVAPRQLMVGARALAHAEPLSETPAPSHPTTAGRPLGRAPTGAIAAA
jgi:hypothetical protein